LNLKNNLGSQRAIIAGLSYLKIGLKKVIVMDSDGKDNPVVIKKMLDISKKIGKNYCC